MKRILDPGSTIAIILGASEWGNSGLPVAPSFRRSAARLMQYMLAPAPHGYGLDPDLALNFFDDPAPPSAILSRMREEMRRRILERKTEGSPIRDILLYYIGHGELDQQGHLHLLVRDTRQAIEIETSIAATSMSQVIRGAAPEQRKVIILDCCFSEAAVEAFGAMGPFDDAVASSAIHDLAPNPANNPDRGTVVLCSSPRGRVSIGPPSARSTLFTGSLLDVLRQGAQFHRGDYLSLSDLRDEIFITMSAIYAGVPPRPALHQPDQQSGDLTELPAFPNVIESAISSEVARSQATESQVSTTSSGTGSNQTPPDLESGRVGRVRMSIHLKYKGVIMISISLSVMAAAFFILLPGSEPPVPAKEVLHSEALAIKPSPPPTTSAQGAASVNPFTPQNPDIFCDRLNAVASSAPQGFKKVVGQKGDMDGSYKPKLSLPGANWCAFNTMPGFGNHSSYLYYSCSLWYDAGTAEEARGAFTAYADLVQKCLGKGWARDDKHAGDESVATFDIDGDHATLKVKFDADSGKKPSVYVQIDPPGR